MDSMLASYNAHMLLSIQMIIDDLVDLSWDYQASMINDTATLRTCRYYSPNEPMNRYTIYFVDEKDYDTFPVNKYAYIASGNLRGEAPHICSLFRPLMEIMNAVLAVFQRYQDFEAELNMVVRGGGSLTELCRVGEKFFNNPMLIHDNLFSLIALPRDIETTTLFQYNDQTGIYHMQLSHIDEFKYDDNYLLSLQKHSANIWESTPSPTGFRSLYVNLWDGNHYYGRLIINERDSALKPGQLKAADYFAEFAIMIILRETMTANRNYLSFEDTFLSIALGQEVSPADLAAVLRILEWKSDDRYLCLRLQSKDSTLSVNPLSAVRSMLATELKSYSSFFYEQQLCVIINLSRSGLAPMEIHQRLATQIRDNYMCGGLSNPFVGFNLLPAAFQQAEAALRYTVAPAANLWLVSFEKCALDYIKSQAIKSLPAELLAAPQLLQLKAIDEEKGTEYYETLRAWLINERDIPKTSDALIVHRTTLTYRIKKLREIFMMDLDDDSTRLYLLLSYRILENNDI